MKGIPSGLRRRTVLIFSMAAACLVAGCATAPGPTILSDWGALYGVDPTDRARRPVPHGGIDYAVAGGDPVLAAAPGEVIQVFDDPSVVPPSVWKTELRGWCGIGALVRHADGVRTIYCHLSSRAVQRGDQVARGQLIGGAGLSGMSNNVVHLHFTVVEGCCATNPHPFLTAGCFDPGKAYPDPKALTYPVRC
jgi:murein DD-endopeptidase MepM/ murein hydrolase activator NlpD